MGARTRLSTGRSAEKAVRGAGGDELTLVPGSSTGSVAELAHAVLGGDDGVHAAVVRLARQLLVEHLPRVDHGDQACARCRGITRS